MPSLSATQLGMRRRDTGPTSMCNGSIFCCRAKPGVARPNTISTHNATTRDFMISSKRISTSEDYFRKAIQINEADYAAHMIVSRFSGDATEVGKCKEGLDALTPGRTLQSMPLTVRMNDAISSQWVQNRQSGHFRAGREA